MLCHMTLLAVHQVLVVVLLVEDQVVEVRRRLGLDDDAKNMLRVWVFRKYIQKDAITGIYIKRG